MEAERPRVNGHLNLLASRAFAAEDTLVDLVDIVDFLNKTFKKKGYIFGASKSKDNKMIIVIYETE